MAWIERHGDRFYVIDRVNGKRVSMPAGTDSKAAKRMCDEINRRKKIGCVERGMKKMEDLYKEAK